MSSSDPAGAVESRVAAQAVAAALAPTPQGDDKGDGVASASSPLSAAQLALARALPKRIYIQIADAAQKPIADTLRAATEARVLPCNAAAQVPRPEGASRPDRGLVAEPALIELSSTGIAA